MIFKHTVQIGAPVIRTKAKLAKPLSKKTKKIVRDLVDSMRFHGLVGMAAPQIGVNLRIFVSEIRKIEMRNESRVRVMVFINPKIIRSSRKKVLGYEGCGSVVNAGLFGKVPRSESVVVRAFGLDGKKFELRATGLLARIIQHETDHLEGKVFLDRMQNMKSIVSRKELLKR